MTAFHKEFSWASYDQYAAALLRKNSLYGALLDSPPLQRLRDVSFLGALELFSCEGMTRGQAKSSRYEHTIGVAHLMLKGCRQLGLSERAEQTLVATALLHDVGHGPLSHSIEPYFKSRFSFGHKHFTARIISGDLFVGNNIPEILADHGIRSEEILARLSREHGWEGSHLLQSSINVDTLDGICRAASFFDGQHNSISPLSLLGVVIAPTPTTEPLGDLFWRLKDRVYNTFILNGSWAVFDAMISRTLRLAHSKVVADDFLLTDAQFRSKFSRELEQVRERFGRRKGEFLYDLHLNSELSTTPRRREFLIDHTVRLDNPADVNRRYFEKKVSDDIPSGIKKH